MTLERRIKVVHNKLLCDLATDYIDPDESSVSFIRWKYGVKNYFERPFRTTIFEDMDILEREGWVKIEKYDVLEHLFVNIHVQAKDVINKALQEIERIREDHHAVLIRTDTPQGMCN